MSRGPTRRVRRLIAAGQVSAQLLTAADHEADLLAHPYIGVEHLHLAQLTLAGRLEERQALRERVQPGVRRRWWRPRGPRSALRRRGLMQTRIAQQNAQD